MAQGINQKCLLTIAQEMKDDALVLF